MKRMTAKFTLENEEGQGWEVRWKSGRMTRDPVVKDREKVAESHERRLYTVRLLFLRLDVGI